MKAKKIQTIASIIDKTPSVDKQQQQQQLARNHFFRYLRQAVLPAIMPFESPIERRQSFICAMDAGRC